MLSKIDNEKIIKILNAYTERDCKNTDKLLQQWVKNKKQIFKFFNKQLKIEQEIDEALPKDQVKYNLDNFIENNRSILYGTITYLRSFTAEELSSNECIENREWKEYLKGQKISRYLRNFIKDEDSYRIMNGKSKSKREYFDIIFSQFIQTLFSKGTLVLSIDPCDYLTMSVNKSDWNSCHSYSGCHAGGMLSYMTDKHSIVGYIKSKKDVTYNINNEKFTHNSKKWRQMVYIDLKNQSCVFSRQYPYDSDVTTKKLRLMISKQFSEMFNIEDKSLLTRNKSKIQSYIDDYCDSPLHYNDILNGYACSCIKMKKEEEEVTPKIILGNTPICPVCGEGKVKGGSYLVCGTCL